MIYQRNNRGESLNLFEIKSIIGDTEITEILAQSHSVRIERIVSAGHTTDWYDQSEHEFVALLQGEAELTYDDGKRVRLVAGDTITIPAHKRHRVSFTTAEPPCVWLCVFWK